MRRWYYTSFKTRCPNATQSLDLATPVQSYSWDHRKDQRTIAVQPPAGAGHPHTQPPTWSICDICVPSREEAHTKRCFHVANNSKPHAIGKGRRGPFLQESSAKRKTSHPSSNTNAENEMDPESWVHAIPQKKKSGLWLRQFSQMSWYMWERKTKFMWGDMVGLFPTIRCPLFVLIILQNKFGFFFNFIFWRGDELGKQFHRSWRGSCGPLNKLFFACTQNICINWCLTTSASRIFGLLHCIRLQDAETQPQSSARRLPPAAKEPAPRRIKPLSF